MAKSKSMMDVVRVIVEELTPLESEERQRVIQASLTLLGEASVKGMPKLDDHEDNSVGDGEGFSSRARSWMRQNDLSSELLSHVFHFDPNGMEIIASDIPGKTNRDKVRNAYVLLGVAGFLSSGETRFDDKAARALCERYGFYDKTNHMKYMRGGNEFTGSKDAGWTVTAPGLKHAAVVIKQLTSGSQ